MSERIRLRLLDSINEAKGKGYSEYVIKKLQKEFDELNENDK